MENTILEGKLSISRNGNIGELQIGLKGKTKRNRTREETHENENGRDETSAANSKL